MSDYNSKCRCGKVRSRSRTDARKQCMFQDKYHGREHKPEENRYYECRVEPGIWHWTRSQPTQRKIDKKLSTCHCKEMPYWNRGHAQKVMETKIKKCDGLEARAYKGKCNCWHIEYILPDNVADVCDCGQVIYKPKGHKDVLRILWENGILSAEGLQCSNQVLHIQRAIPKTKEKK